MQKIFFLGLGIFVGLVILQIILWQLFKIKKEMFNLAIIFIFMPMPIFICIYIVSGYDFIEIILSSLLCYALASVYVQTYPALREDTPSFRLLLLIDKAGKKGLSREEITASFAATDLFSQKMSDLKHDGLVQVNDDGSFMLNSAGKKLAKIFKCYRDLLGLEMGEG